MSVGNIEGIDFIGVVPLTDSLDNRPCGEIFYFPEYPIPENFKPAPTVSGRNVSELPNIEDIRNARKIKTNKQKQ